MTSILLLGFAMGCFFGYLVATARYRKRILRYKLYMNAAYGKIGNPPKIKGLEEERVIYRDDDSAIYDEPPPDLPPFICPCGNEYCRRGGWLSGKPRT